MKESRLTDFLGGEDAERDGESDRAGAETDGEGGESDRTGTETDGEGGDRDSADGTIDSGANAEADAAGSGPAADAEIDPADGPTVTYASGVDRSCAACGAAADRFWRADEGFVCPACVEW
ncbi:hypothetical protein [Halovivax sp.]|uniref:DUF7573 domain-containing protein n=1 Tax=Halovivax sp. TaxID=1935978 RepID=UPI0025B994E0|nr:hypothetical protein [Halovivax sp.]